MYHNTIEVVEVTNQKHVVALARTAWRMDHRVRVCDILFVRDIYISPH